MFNQQVQHSNKVKLDLESLLSIAIEAAEEACKKILSVYNSGKLRVQFKTDDSPLTLADKFAHKAISKVLREYSSIPILSEEGKHSVRYAERERWVDFWMVDPLDGTKEFLKRNGEFTVNIAMVSNNFPVLGVVAVPVTGEIYFAQNGRGAFLRHGGVTTKLQPRNPADLTQSGLRVVASRSHMNEQTESFIAHLHNPNLVSVGSSLKFLAIAKGAADIYPRFVPSMEWDTAAAHAIIKEVGLTIKNVFNHEELRYNKKDLLNPFFICH
jgi:3'(2'), 5'-bisphosphate nucleotidase